MKTLKKIVKLKSAAILLALAASWFMIPGSTLAQSANKLLRKGNSDYENGKFTDAEKNYRKALEQNQGSFKGKFNLGDAVYQQKNWEESSKIFSGLTQSNLDEATRAKVWHNLGNTLLESKDYDKSILAYQNALLHNPSDLDTKYNLEYAKMMLKKQQQQQQQQKNDQKKDQQKQKQDQQNKDQNQEKKDQPPPDQKKISKQDAERMLEALKNNEKKTLEKLKKEKAAPQQTTIDKDW
ncbi:MAG TPA: tetratricopeptide repeat protein [Bacteroidales bacterium]|nr:tetratricopeptide repeat protein [Bacteroidales bacterium]